MLSFSYPAASIGEAGYSIARLCTSVRVRVTTLQRCGGTLDCLSVGL